MFPIRKAKGGWVTPYINPPSEYEKWKKLSNRQITGHGYLKKGQSGNPGGRPKGSISLKEYAKRYLHELDEEGKKAFMDGLPKDVIWKMAEGNPQTNSDITSAGKPIPLLDYVRRNNSTQEDTETQEET